MRAGTAISSICHGLVISLLFTNGFFAIKKVDNKPKELRVNLIPVSAFDAFNSSEPEIFTPILPEKVMLSEQKVLSTESSSFEDEMTKKIEIPKIINGSKLEPISNLLNNLPKLSETYRDLNLQTESQLNKNVKLNSEKISLGNESAAVESKFLDKPKARNEDRIDKVAAEKSDIEDVKAIAKNAVETSDSADSIRELSNSASAKASSTSITPEGKKNVAIVLSGAPKQSSSPLSRPIDVSNASETSLDNEIETILKNLPKDEEDTKQVNVKQKSLSNLQKKTLMNEINSLVGKYWNKGILIGSSDFENYIVQVEFTLNSSGYLIGEVKPVKPKNPKGRYAVAFREASNAIKEAGRIPLPSNTFKKGVRLILTFDPASGINFN